jgi:hypothetical protein
MYRHAAVALFIGLSLAACGGVTSPSQNTKDSFSNTINPGAGASFSYTFNVANTGELTITVTNMTPSISTSTVFTVGYGLSQSGSCQPINYNTLSTVGFPALSGIQITPGAYCAFIQDEGLFTVPETFTLVVSHP